MAIRNALIAVDFDGTVVTHAYPEIGDDAGAVPVLKELTDNGCRLILFTMRHGKLLDDAIRWFRERGIPLYAVNENPSQQRWTSSPKVHADLYIDDSSLGCPIRFVDGVKRPVADWTRIRKQLVKEGFWTEPPRRRLCDEGGGQRADEGLTEERVKAKSRTNPGTGGASKAENRRGGKMKTGEADNTGNRRSR